MPKEKLGDVLDDRDVLLDKLEAVRDEIDDTLAEFDDDDASDDSGGGNGADADDQ